MGAAIRQYEAKDFAALHKLDQTCFPAGIAYSKFSLQYFLGLPAADCLVAEDAKRITGFILAETNAPLAHVITLDVAASQRRAGLGSLLLVFGILELGLEQQLLWCRIQLGPCTRLELAYGGTRVIQYTIY